MPVVPRGSVQRCLDGETIKRAADLLSQQIWCWGQDIVRPEGNWLLDLGFDRRETPAGREKCSSVYSLELPGDRRVVLRGFGVFFGDDRLGGVFVKRYDFRALYTPLAALEQPPWSSEDLPDFSNPTAAQSQSSTSLTAGLIHWISDYEMNIGERLSVEYRRATLDRWTKNKRPLVPAEEMVSAWRSIGVAVGEDF
ncbi:MAG: hypothetical protein AAGB00_04060 [Planctomycetota bacterium]